MFFSGMTGTTSPCTLSQSMPENISGMKLYSNCDLLKGGACNACKDYIALEVKLSATKQIPDDLLSQRSKMRTRINQNHDLLTTSVPLEIVYSIFKFCVPEKSSFNVFNDTDTEIRDERMASAPAAPLLLGRICRTWRNIAWGMKPLWTRFRLDLAHLENPNNVDLTREWLDRAGQLPLSIHVISAGYLETEQEGERAAQLLALVNERSKQWDCLDLADSYGWTSRLTGGSGGAPNLQVLKLRCIKTDDDFKLALAGLKPSQLFLHCCDLDLIHIGWNHLTCVCVSELYLDQCTELLRRAPNLVDCKLYLVCENYRSFRSESFPIHEEPIIYPSLQRLKFDCPHYDESLVPEILTFLKSFIFSNLKHLKLQSGGVGYDIPDDLSWDPLVAHIVNASPPLISLGIFLHPGLQPTHQCIIPILRRTPSLRDLEMFAPFDEEWEGEQTEFFKLLANTSTLADDRTETTFLPNLQSIKFQLYAEEEEFRDRFWKSVSGIFGPISEIHDPRRRPLRELRVRDGLDLDIEESCNYKLEVCIKSKDAVLQLLKLKQEGITLDLKSLGEGINLLENSVELLGLQDWSDN